MGTATDREPGLVTQCVMGDQQAWQTLVQRHAGLITGILRGAYRLSPTDADDAFQEVLCRLYCKLATLRDDRALAGWIAQVTRNVALDTLRRNGREQPLGDDIERELRLYEDPTQGVLEALTVRQALGTLPEHQREIIQRFFVQDESYQTIGAALGIPAGTIASRISRALATLRSEVDDRTRAAMAA